MEQDDEMMRCVGMGGGIGTMYVYTGVVWSVEKW